MQKSTFLIFIVLLAGLLVAGCSNPSNASAAAVEAYFQALASKNAEQLVGSSCAAWEASARTELESFGAVQVSLESLACQEISSENDIAAVSCSGKLVANYGNEILEINLADRQYNAVNEGGDWRMCGYR